MTKYKKYLCQKKFWLESFAVLLAGGVMPLGFAPFEMWFIPVISLSVLMLLTKQKTPKASFFLCFAFGVGMFGVGVTWVFNSLYHYGQAPAILAGIITAALVLILALFVSAVGYSMNKWFKSPVWVQFIFVFPALWILHEWVRSWILTGFPWLLLGYTQLDTFIAPYIPFIGALGTGGIIAIFSGCLATIIVAEKKGKAVALVTVLVLGAGAFWLEQYKWVEPAGEGVNIAVVQGNIPQEIKLKAEYLEFNLNRYVELSREHYDNQIMIWPETAVPTYKYYAEPFFMQLLKELKHNNVELLTGVFELDKETGQYYNSLYKVGDDGPLYRKQHLVPFGEFMPFRWLLSFLDRFIKIPMSDIGIGEPLAEPIMMHGIPMGMSICYESAYIDVFRQQLPRAELLVNVSNDAWFGESLAPHQHLEINRVRALESGRYMLRATNTGISAIIDQKGKVLARSDQNQAQVLAMQVLPYTGDTFYIRVGNYLCISVAICILVLLRLFVNSKQKAI